MSKRGDHEKPYRATNVEGTRAVAEAAAAEVVGQIIFASSIKAISEGGADPLNDDTPSMPRDAYGRSKLEAEEALRRVSQREGLPATILRFPLVYGAGVKGNVRRLFDAVWNGLPLPVGQIQNQRTMLGVDNLIAFLRRIVEHPITSDKAFGLGDRESESTEALIRMIGAALDRPPRIVVVPPRILHLLARIGDAASMIGARVSTSEQLKRLTGSLVIDSTRAWEAAGLEPPVSLASGIERTAVWYRSLEGFRRH